MKNCPKCGAPLQERTNIGITVEECASCGYWHNTATGEEKILDRKAKSCLLKCPSCASKLRIFGEGSNPILHIGDTATCSFCNAEFAIPEKPDPDLFLNVACPHCSEKSRVPANKGNLSVTCPHCKNKFLHDTGTWPERRPDAKQSNSTDYTQASKKDTWAATNANECYQCPKCGWTYPDTNALNESIAAHTQCQNCGNSYLVHLTWDD